MDAVNTAICHHCKEECVPVELEPERYDEIDFHGVACLPEVDQAIYEGVNLCVVCYEKEGGIC